MPKFQVVRKDLKGRYFIMEEYTKVLREYLQGRRNITKRVYKVISRDYRAIMNGKMTWTSLENQISKGGAN